MFGEALGQLLGGRGQRGGGKGKQRLTDACKKQRTGTFHVKLPRDDKNQLKRCLCGCASYTASSVMTTDYTGKSEVCTSWKQSWLGL